MDFSILHTSSKLDLRFTSAPPRSLLRLGVAQRSLARLPPALTQFLGCTRTKTGSRPARPVDLSPACAADNVSLALLAKCLSQNATQFTVTG